MSKPLPASEKVMVEYLKELLTEEPELDLRSDVVMKPVENLLKQVKETETRVVDNEHYLENLEKKFSTREPDSDKINHVSDDVIEQVNEQVEQNTAQVKEKSYRQGSFQALFFEVAGLNVAVPLIELGGIHNIEQINSLLGKPPWFKGVMLHKDEQFNVVDTAQWVMPEKYNEELKNSLNYQYIILLNDSRWGLSAEKLVNTVTLEQDDVKWRDSPGKRPWLAGLVKDRMCALLDVDAMISLLDQGMNVQSK